jgi:predicted TIM-barrel fold metal-dependent hydrolase
MSATATSSTIGMSTLLGSATEPAIDPGLPIVDTHHHMYDRLPEHHLPLAGGRRRYLIDELLDDMNSGHNVIATVFVDGDAMYRADGPSEYRVVGETEFVNGQAAMSASGLYGPSRIALGIVGTADCRIGERVKGVLEAHLVAGGGRFRGIRQTGAWDADASIVGGMFKVAQHMYLDPGFRRGFAHLAPLGLSFDAFVLSPQLADVADLATAFPHTRIVLDHAGGLVGIGPYRGRLPEMFPAWKQDIEDIARRPNVVVKLGGLGSFVNGFPSYRAEPPVSSEVLAAEWRPYVETCIEAFGAGRCMFESNYPVDSGAGAYGTIINAYKRITAGCSASERASIFSETATNVYRLPIGAAIAA